MAFYSHAATPTLWLDSVRVKRNIQRMVEMASNAGADFRPHFKTHQSLAVANWFNDVGVRKIATSSVRMAHYFSDGGWSDITIAFPANLHEAGLINQIAGNSMLNLLFEDPAVVARFDQVLESSVGGFIKIDIGTQRTGIRYQQIDRILDCIRAVQSAQKIDFRGLLIHAGHTYRARSKGELEASVASVLFDIKELRDALVAETGQEVLISYGDTPSCSIGFATGNVQEFRPGNFVFYDLMQEQIGACRADDIAVMVTCPVVAVHNHRNQAIVYGGAIHFGRDSMQLENGELSFGREVRLMENNWSTDIGHPAHLTALSQEHGIVTWKEGHMPDVIPGDILGFLPIHSCMTAQYIGRYSTLDGRKLDHFVRSDYY